MSTQLSNAMKQLWADNFALYTKSHGFHVNVTGCGFFANHQFLEKIYVNFQEYIDRLAEGSRTWGDVVPFSIDRIRQLTQIVDETVVPCPEDMWTELYADVETVKQDAIKAFDLCQKEKCYGLQNILADYLEDAEKLCWMLGASMEDPAVAEAEMAADKEMGIPEEPTPKL
jgi:starvation-inducible DNA-binding protein